MKAKAILISLIGAIFALAAIAWVLARPTFVSATDMNTIREAILPTTDAYAMTLTSPARRPEGLRATLGPSDLSRLKEVFHRRFILTEWLSLQNLSEEASHLIVLKPRGGEPVSIWVDVKSGKMAIDDGPFREMSSSLARDIREFLLDLGLPMNLRVFDALNLKQ